MPAILLLGPGTSRHRLHRTDKWGDDKTDYLTVVDNDDSVAATWPDATFHCIDLRYTGTGSALTLELPFSPNLFAEVHSYEVLNLLPGDERAFFAFWREMWRIMELGGKFYATVPHWESQWIHSYPAPQRTYTPALLTFLDRDIHLTAGSHFTHLWPEPYCFKVTGSWYLSNAEGKNQGFHFELQKHAPKFH